MGEFNRSEFEEYLSGTSDVVVAVLTYSLQSECGRSGEDTDTKEYGETVSDMMAVASKEYNERDLDWKQYDKQERSLLDAIAREDNMKDEELLTRSRDEKERDFGPPYFECSFTSDETSEENTVWKLQNAQDVAKHFPWARGLVYGCSENFELKLVDGYEVIKIQRVA